MKPFAYIKHQLYLLQLENYELKRFWVLLCRNGYFKLPEAQRKDLIWTPKIRLIFGISILICIGLLIFVASISLYLSFFVFILSFFFLPIFYTVILFLIYPVEYLVKQSLINKAKRIIADDHGLKIIGIAGSYGKTTMRATLESVLSQKFKVLATPESVNTPLGIADWIIKKYKKNTEILIVEMGEHYTGDIEYLCKMMPPDISIVTGINEAHMERMGSIEMIASTIFEIGKDSKLDAKFFLNGDDKNILKYYKRNFSDGNAEFYSANDKKITSKCFDKKELGWNLDIFGIGDVHISIIGEYILGNVIVVSQIGLSLGMTVSDIKKGLALLQPVEHRLQPIRGNGNVLVIDDSYNGNPDGVREAIKVLGSFSDRRKIYLTPGLVETGPSNQKIHTEIGRHLAEVADIVVLIKNSVTPYIASGLESAGFKKENIIWFDTALLAHKSLDQILKPNDVILFQNDWGDQYA